MHSDLGFASQVVLDTNGNGKRDAYLDSEQKVLSAPSGESLGASSALQRLPVANV